jgi:hypothetical protein
VDRTLIDPFDRVEGKPEDHSPHQHQRQQVDEAAEPRVTYSTWLRFRQIQYRDVTKDCVARIAMAEDPAETEKAIARAAEPQPEEKMSLSV